VDRGGGYARLGRDISDTWLGSAMLAKGDDTEEDMPWGSFNKLLQQLREDEERLYQRLMNDPVTVISERDDPGEKAYLAWTFRWNQLARERVTS
jgi:hypothetical protein